MFSILIIACLVSSPQVCSEFETPTEHELLPIQCHSAMREWAMEHPKFRVSRFKCGRIEREI